MRPDPLLVVISSVGQNLGDSLVSTTQMERALDSKE